MSNVKNNFLKIVESAVNNNVSDIHFRSGEKPYFRMKGDLIPVKVVEFSEDDVLEILNIITESELVSNSLKELDGSYEIEGLCRLRFNFLKFQGKSALIFRVIPKIIPTIESLKLPKILKKISGYSNGLVLVTGATGSGKSSTLAAMIDYINENRAVHVLTLEDPIEFLHESKKSRITQREVGHDTDDFNSALRSSLRQDPDIILIGEMRDALTIKTAIKAAETGHLVFGTVHTTDALNTIGRLISMFPPEEQETARERIAENLKATISQRLLKTIDNKSRLAAQEIMINTPGVKDALLNSKKTHEIYTYIEKGFLNEGTQSFDQHITQLYEQKLISIEEAEKHASNPGDFRRNLIFNKRNS